MTKRIKTIIALSGMAATCALLAACGGKSLIDDYKNQGNIVTVTYEASGGAFLDRDKSKIVDMFNPEKYTADADGTIRIKLLDPLDPKRPTGSSGNLTLTKTGYSLVGWYTERTEKKNAEGKLVDEAGNVLVADEDRYLIEGTTTESSPAYEYSGHWDFSSDALEYTKGSGEKELTLYAAWSPYFKFEYYAKEDGVWAKYGETEFDYEIANRENASAPDKDTVYLPAWADGAMNYDHPYQNSEVYSFPKKKGTTFAKAYLDEACTKEIEGSFEHQGFVDYEHGKAVDSVQKIYVELDEGEQYKIQTVEQFLKYANADGYYEIDADSLDFAGKTWPASFVSGTFRGRIYGKDNKQVVFKNISAKFNHQSSTTGGLFGKIAKGAWLKNVTFENATLDVGYVGAGLYQYKQFGLVSGNIEEGAVVSDVKLTGENTKVRFGQVNLGSDYDVNLVANGVTQGVSNETHILLEIYGKDLGVYVDFKIDYRQVTVDKDLNVKFVFGTRFKEEQETYNIEYKETNNG